MALDASGQWGASDFPFTLLIALYYCTQEVSHSLRRMPIFEVSGLCHRFEVVSAMYSMPLVVCSQGSDHDDGPSKGRDTNRVG